MTQLCSWATVHWMRFDGPRTADALDLSAAPAGASCWKIGSDGAAAPDGSRLTSDIWCALGSFPSRDDAEASFDSPMQFLPFLDETVEYWQALLQPVSHKGECNHFDRAKPGPMFAAAADSGEGPMLVMTTA